MTAFDNSQAREAQVWVPFLHYGFYDSIQQAERAVIFGLYSNSYRNNDAYLQGIFDIELANLLSNYNAKIADLTADEQKLVMDISAKRYVTALDGLVHDAKMQVELNKISASSDEWDAKMLALDADRAALETLRVKISAEMKKISARIMELQAYITLEQANLAMVDVDIAEKNLMKSKKDLELVEKDIEESKRDIAILHAANEIAKVQLQIVEAGLELLEVDMKVARTENDIAQTENQIARAGMAESELEVAKARTTAEEAELETYDSKLTLAGMQIDAIDKEVSSVEDSAADEKTIHQEKIEHVAAVQSGRLQSIANQTEQHLFGIQNRDVSATLDKTISEKTDEVQAATDLDKIRVQDVQKESARVALHAAVAAADIMATADVASVLTHTIGKK